MMEGSIVESRAFVREKNRRRRKMQREERLRN